MLGKSTFRAALFFAFALPLCVSAAGVGNVERLPDWVVKLHHPFRPPPGGVVRDAHTAIAVAYHIYWSINPPHLSDIPKEDIWEKDMVAHLENGVWTVEEADRPGDDDTIGGGLFIFIAQKDGRILQIIITQ
jgi:hypothetical protein